MNQSAIAPAPGQKIGICQYNLKGTCSWGLKCRFSHETATESRKEDQAAQRRLSAAQVSFEAWMTSRPADHTLDPKFSTWIGHALALLDEGADIQQQIIHRLSSEQRLITSIIEAGSRASTAQKRSETLEDIIMPLFQIMAHPEVANSIVLAPQVARIYEHMFHDDCGFLIRLYDRMIDMVQKSIAEKNFKEQVVETEGLPLVALSSAVLSKAAAVSVAKSSTQRHLEEIVKRVTELIAKVPGSDTNAYCIEASKHLGAAKAHFSAAAELVPSKLTRLGAVNWPGKLNGRGPRHDNDLEDIAKIKIMPTLHEIAYFYHAYLPTVDTSTHHLEGIAGLVDRQFRLLREDAFSDLRKAVISQLDVLNGRKPAANTAKEDQVWTYNSPFGVNIGCSPRDGLKLNISIPQPTFAQASSQQDRIQAWLNPARLTPGSLVCAIDGADQVVFLLVSFSTVVSATRRRGNSRKEPMKPRRTLADERDFAYVCLEPVEQTREEIAKCLAWYKSLRGLQNRKLLEFPNVLMASTRPFLEALQKMSRDRVVPFQNILTNPSSFSEGIPAPLYTRRDGFTFDLSSLCEDKWSLKFDPKTEPDARQLSDRSTLDLTQAEAVLNTLKRSIAITQGPPGTGKSYTGEALVKVLLTNRPAGNLGPIVCVCFTNHALDQLLERLVDSGIKGIIRIGSQSQSVKLEPNNLRHVLARTRHTKAEALAIAKTGALVSEDHKRIVGILRRFATAKIDDLLRGFLAKSLPHWHHELFLIGGARSKNASEVMKTWVANGPESFTVSRPLHVLLTLNPSALTRRERFFTHQHILGLACPEEYGNLLDAFDNFYSHKQEEVPIRSERKIRCLSQASIIGVTNTGLVRNLDVLRRVGAKVLLCEEAAEVQEGHLLTALLPTIEHAIFIGDHQQLRPQVQDWRLQSSNPKGVQYSLDVSLFERLVNPASAGGSGQGIPFNLLETQRRMHPSISELVRSTLYPSLKDADNVSEYPGVAGMTKRLFWFDHTTCEDSRGAQDPNDTSRSNAFEVDMVSALVSFILRQGVYKAGDIAVLTPYLGQLNKMRETLSKTMQLPTPGGPIDESPITNVSTLDLVRLASVDNFQGEEAKVVIISLVRCNPAKSPGFLNTSNRINVLLSRAKHGMYIIGNSDTFSGVPMWRDVLHMLREGGNIGKAFQLQCSHHPNNQIMARKPEDFESFVPNGSCGLPCAKALKCGHKCLGNCHSDVHHSMVACSKPCSRPLEGCGHPCPARCNEPCPKHCEKVLKDLTITLECGHLVPSTLCWKAQNPENIKCRLRIDKETPGCGHIRQVACHRSANVTGYNCHKECGRRLSCGHACEKRCFECPSRQEGEEENLMVMEGGEVTELRRCDSCEAAVEESVVANGEEECVGALDRLRKKAKQLQN